MYDNKDIKRLYEAYQLVLKVESGQGGAGTKGKLKDFLGLSRKGNKVTRRGEMHRARQKAREELGDESPLDSMGRATVGVGKLAGSQEEQVQLEGKTKRENKAKSRQERYKKAPSTTPGRPAKHATGFNVATDSSEVPKERAYPPLDREDRWDYSRRVTHADQRERPGSELLKNVTHRWMRKADIAQYVPGRLKGLGKKQEETVYYAWATLADLSESKPSTKRKRQEFLKDVLGTRENFIASGKARWRTPEQEKNAQVANRILQQMSKRASRRADLADKEASIPSLHAKQRQGQLGHVMDPLERHTMVPGEFRKRFLAKRKEAKDRGDKVSPPKAPWMGSSD